MVLKHRSGLDEFPNVDFSDPRGKLASVAGTGLQDIVLVHNGRIDYWPNLGNGNWGARVTMRNSPRFNDAAYALDFDPRRVLIGDVDGDGLADLVYVDDGRIRLWINRGGNRWSERIWTVVATCALTGQSVFTFLLASVKAYWSGAPPRSLLG